MVNAAWIDGSHSPTGVLVRESSTYHARTEEELPDDTAYEVWQAMIGAALDGVALRSIDHPPGLIDNLADAIRDGRLSLKPTDKT